MEIHEVAKIQLIILLQYESMAARLPMRSGLSIVEEPGNGSRHKKFISSNKEARYA